MLRRILDIARAERAYKMGKRFSEIGDFGQSIRSFSEAIQRHPNKWVAYHGRGATFLKVGDYENAISDFNRCIELVPHFGGAYYARGNTLLWAGNPSQAISDFSAAIERNPKDDLAYCARGNAYLFSGRPDPAVFDFERALQLNPDRAVEYNQNRKLAYKIVGGPDPDILPVPPSICTEDRWGEIADNWTSWINRRPNNPAKFAYLIRGIAEYAVGNDTSAVEDFGQAINVAPFDPVAYDNRGIAYHALGEYDYALADFARALELNISYYPALYHEALSFRRRPIPVRTYPYLNTKEVALLGHSED